MKFQIRYNLYKICAKNELTNCQLPPLNEIYRYILCMYVPQIPLQFLQLFEWEHLSNWVSKHLDHLKLRWWGWHKPQNKMKQKSPSRKIFQATFSPYLFMQFGLLLKGKWNVEDQQKAAKILTTVF